MVTSHYLGCNLAGELWRCDGGAGTGSLIPEIF
ncbi:uncharacterized protein METZ01_LOCUS104447 [marine metagenome]|uniref:Uncharacterized protein n=1 Tax=marine metagenome TaxID=408172 RepID=A0A381WI44_9ZZZZ